MKAIPAVLDATIVTSFRTGGWARLSGVLSQADVDLIAAAIVQAEHEVMTGWVGQVGDAAGRQTFAHQQSPRWKQMFRNETDLRLIFPQLHPIVKKLADVARALLRRDDVRVIYDQTFTKPPVTEGTRETPWHQDLPYVPLDRRGFMTFWIPIEDVTEDAGALRFVPGSHRLGPLGRFSLLADSSSLDDIVAPEDRALLEPPVIVPLSRGELTVHDGLTLHGAGPNLGGQPRRAWTVQFIPADTLYTGAPFPLKRISELGLAAFSRFDHPSFDPHCAAGPDAPGASTYAP